MECNKGFNKRLGSKNNKMQQGKNKRALAMN